MLKTKVRVWLLLGMLLGGCASDPYVPDAGPLNSGRLSPPDIAIRVPGLGPCTDAPDRTLNLDSTQPVTILVHGCFGSAGRFRTLAQVLAFHGQQTACFSYDDRESLVVSSGQLARSIDHLANQLRHPDITVIGHSQGGLVARRAVVADRTDPVTTSSPLRLVTVSAPFAGIEAANICAHPAVRIGTLGLNDVLCWAISGSKWHEITERSAFIRQPGALHPNVSGHLKVVTDETGACREFAESGQCRRDDFVFSVREQGNSLVDVAPGVTSVEVRAGHVEIVGETGVIPEKLIAVLQREGVIRPTAPDRQAEFKSLLAQWYGR